MTELDRFIDFDHSSGTLRAEAGAALGAIMALVVPRGFFLPVVPGTRFVSLGGAIANDVHGKNHHRAGTFGRHVNRLGLLRGDGMRLEVGPDSNSKLFSATVGGLGLTGIIEWAELKLERIASSQLEVELIPFAALSEFWQLADESNRTHEHTVAWIDATTEVRKVGRGVFSRGNWSDEGGFVVHHDRQQLTIPFEAPSGLTNGLTMRLFNRLYHAVQKRKARTRRQHYAQFFHPLDRISNWNRLYGRPGFWQYQCVVPRHAMKDAIAALLREISISGQVSCLAVLKTFGDIPSPGLLSFPMEGATLALDFPNKAHTTLALFSRLDAIVKEAKGRLYAAKDGRIPKELWRVGYPRLEQFIGYVDPIFSSDFWRRVTS
jgi:L-gulonolactone oxidase